MPKSEDSIITGLGEYQLSETISVPVRIEICDKRKWRRRVLRWMNTIKVSVAGGNTKQEVIYEGLGILLLNFYLFFETLSHRVIY